MAQRNTRAKLALGSMTAPLPPEVESALRDLAAYVAVNVEWPEDAHAFDAVLDSVWFQDVVIMQDELGVIIDAGWTSTFGEWIRDELRTPSSQARQLPS